jgi:hypothetical protein
VVEGTISISGTEAKVLIDPRSTYSFVASHFACAFSFGDKAIPCNVVVSKPLGREVDSKVCYEDCEMRLSDVIFAADLIRLPIDDYDIILGVDCLSRHYVQETVSRKQYIPVGLESTLCYLGEMEYDTL